MPRLLASDNASLLDFSEQGRLHWLIGRNPRCDLFLDDAGVSRFHATLFRWHEDVYIVDHSLNGTYLCEDASPLAPTTRLPSLSSASIDALASKPPEAPALRRDTAEVSLPMSFSETGMAGGEDDTFDPASKSRIAYLVEKMDTHLPRVAGYEPHGLKTSDDMRSLLESVYSAEAVQNLASMGRKLLDGHHLVFVGEKRYEVTFEA